MEVRKQVVKVFCISTLFVAVFIGVAIFGYSYIMKQYGIAKEEQQKIDTYLKQQSQTSEETLKDVAQIKTVVKTIHFVMDEESEEIKEILIEILNATAGKMLYLTVPMDLKVTLSSLLYDRLNAESVMVPQMFKLSMLPVYFAKEKQIESARKIVEDSLSIKADYYSVIPLTVFETMFTKTGDGAYAYQEEYMQSQLSKIKDMQIKELLQEICASYDTDFTYEDRMLYRETYESLDGKDYLFEQIIGEQRNDSFVLNTKENKERILRFSGQ